MSGEYSGPTSGLSSVIMLVGVICIIVVVIVLAVLSNHVQKEITTVVTDVRGERCVFEVDGHREAARGECLYKIGETATFQQNHFGGWFVKE